MRNLLLILVAAILVTVAAAAAAAPAADESKADRRALRAAQKQLHSRVTSQRVEAVERLRDLPALEGAKSIVPSLLIDPEAEVRHAAYKTLVHWKEHREVCLFLLKTLDKESRSKSSEVPVVVALLAVLLASDLPEIQRDLSKFLDDYGVKGQDGATAVAAMADELGQQGDAQALTSLRRMTRLKCFASSFACRRAVIQAMILARLPQAIEASIALLPDVDGEARGDIVRYLSEVSGEQHGTNREAWQAWWKAHQEQFKFPPRTGTNLPAAVALPGQPSYYGLAIQARRMVFVVDISSSMEGPRLLAAKRELIQTIDSLPKDAAFSIAAFNSRVMVWQRNLLPATPAAKQAAAAYVCGLRAGGMTAAYDALEAAFRLDAEAIYFLSDGEPTAGRMIVPQAIVAAVSEANRSRRVSIYTIGIVPGRPGSPLDLFMKTLAEQNFGSYRRVER